MSITAVTEGNMTTVKADPRLALDYLAEQARRHYAAAALGVRTGERAVAVTNAGLGGGRGAVVALTDQNSRDDFRSSQRDSTERLLK